jgi:hypothetical protein
MAASLVGHHELARWFGVSAAMIPCWVATGAWPLPQAVRSTTLYYRHSEADCWLRTGRWPDGARFLHRTRSPRREPTELWTVRPKGPAG